MKNMRPQLEYGDDYVLKKCKLNTILLDGTSFQNGQHKDNNVYGDLDYIAYGLM